MQLDLIKATSQAFAFLSDVGFTQVEAPPQIVRYRKGELEAVVYRDPSSYEVGFEIGYGAQKYSIGEVIRLVDRPLGEEYRDPSVTDQAALSPALLRLAGLVKTYAQRAIAGDQSVFGALEQQRKAMSEDYALEVLARQTRPKAEEAFRKQDYAEAARLYESIESKLSASETKKLAMAQARSGIRH